MDKLKNQLSFSNDLFSQKNKPYDFVATLSIYIIVLSFFIFLNAVSSFDEDRSYGVIDSVQKSFHSQIENKFVLEEEYSGFKIGAHMKVALDNLSSLFNHPLSLINTTDNSITHKYFVEIDHSSFFSLDGYGISPDGISLLSSISDTLNSLPLHSYRITIEDRLASNQWNSYNFGQENEYLPQSHRLANVAMHLEENSISDQSIALMLSEGERASLYFIFEFL